MAFRDQLLPSRMFTYLLSSAGKNLVEKSETHEITTQCTLWCRNYSEEHVIVHLDVPLEQFFSYLLTMSRQDVEVKRKSR